MRIKVLGSAAAECCPALWCECEFCEKARKEGGKNLRRRTSYLIDDDTLVDLGPDFFWQIHEFGINETKLKRLIVTHPHEDHLNPVEFLWRYKGFSQVSKDLHVLGAKSIMTRIMFVTAFFNTAYRMEDIHLKPVQLEHGKYAEDGDIGILPLHANHAPGMSPFVYFISRGGRKIFICNDTGFLPEESLQAAAGQQADLVFIDSTMGLKHPDHQINHLGVNAVVKLRDRLLEIGALKKDAVVIANHFSHNGKPLQSDLEAFFNPKGIQVAYDGMTLEL